MMIELIYAFLDTSIQIIAAAGAVIAISIYAYVTINEKNEKMNKVIQMNQTDPSIEVNSKALDLNQSFC